MRVFLTGATGFVGSHVARQLVRHGHEVHALVLDREGEEELLQRRLGEEAARIVQVRGDLLRPESWAGVVAKERFEACVHLGWYANPKDYLYSRLNVDLLSASTNLGSKLIDAGCRRVVMAGTCFEYDVDLGFLTETTSLRPRHLYSTCKRAVFDVMSQLTAGPGTSFAWTRLFFLYGPHESRGRLVPAVIDSLLDGQEARVTSGEQIRDFMHVADAAAGIVHVLETDTLTGAVNVASGRPVRVRKVVKTIAKLLNREKQVAWGAILPRPNDPGFVCADVTRLTASGFRPQHDLDSGLRDTIAWSKSERARSLAAQE